MKKQLKVSDKNKLGERRKLIIHNRQFTWMSTAEKLKLPSSKKEKKPFSDCRHFCSAHSGHIESAIL